MTGSRIGRRSAFACMVVALMGGVLAPLMVASAVQAATGPPPRPDTGKLTPALAEVAQAPTGRRAQPAETAAPKRTPDGSLLVDLLVTDTSPATLDATRAAGGRIVAIESPATAINDPLRRGGKLFTVTVAVTDAKLAAVVAVPAVRSAQEVLGGAGIGAVTSEGDTVLRAAAARALGPDGTGITVGVLSDSYNAGPAGAATTAAQDVASCDLPGIGNTCGHTTPVNVIDDTAGGKDEGRAMLQTVHDMAPGANLAFATAANGETAFATNIAALVTAGANVIVDDYIFFAEPMYQDGPVAVAINNARAAGVTYISMAYNNNMVIGGNDVGSYEAQAFRATPCPTLPFAYLDCHDFDSGAGTDNTYNMTVNDTAKVDLDLQWAQPRGGVTADYDIFVLNPTGGAVLAQSTNNNEGGGTQRPFERVTWTNATGAAMAVNVVIARQAGPAVRMKFVHLQNGAQGLSALEYNTSAGTDVIGPTIFGHNGAASAFTVAAVPQNNAAVPEPYSSHGPVTLLFQPVPSTTALGAPQVLTKPDFAAVDCVINTFFPPPSNPTNRFCGTSDAAPHAAGVAALLLSFKPALTPTQVGATLSATAIPVGMSPPNVVGAGLIQADAAVQSLSPTPPPPPCTTTLSGDVNGPVTVSAGTTTCVAAGGRIVGPVTVNAGGNLVVTGAQITRGIVANGAAYVKVCGSDVSRSTTPGAPSIQVTGSTGPVIIGDVAGGCAANRVAGGVTLTSNSANLTLGNNTVVGDVAVNTNTVGLHVVKGNSVLAGALNCAGNNPPPGNAGQVNTAANGKTGQCASI